MESRLNFMQWFVRYATPPLDPEIKKKKQHEKIKKRKKKKEKRKEKEGISMYSYLNL